MQSIASSLSHSQFLYIDPLKQGLKLLNYNLSLVKKTVFIHRSIKTRIETGGQDLFSGWQYCFYT